MSKRTNIAALFMVFALLLCEFGLAVTDNSYRIASDGFGVSSGSGEAREASLSEDVDVTFVDYDTPELISARHSGSLFSVRSQSKGREFQRGGLRLLLLLASVLCLLRIALRPLRFSLLLPGDADAASVILCFIHRKDGKK